MSACKKTKNKRGKNAAAPMTTIAMKIQARSVHQSFKHADKKFHEFVVVGCGKICRREDGVFNGKETTKTSRI